MIDMVGFSQFNAAIIAPALLGFILFGDIGGTELTFGVFTLAMSVCLYPISKVCVCLILAPIARIGYSSRSGGFTSFTIPYARSFSIFWIAHQSAHIIARPFIVYTFVFGIGVATMFGPFAFIFAHSIKSAGFSQLGLAAGLLFSALVGIGPSSLTPKRFTGFAMTMKAVAAGLTFCKFARWFSGIALGAILKVGDLHSVSLTLSRLKKWRQAVRVTAFHSVELDAIQIIPNFRGAY